MRRTWLFGFLVAVLSSASSRANADAGEVSWVRGDGAEGCPNAEEMRKLVAERLGRSSLELGDRTLSGFISLEPDGWRARVYLRDKAGTLVGSRDLKSDAAACGPLANAVALAMALAIDPDAVSRAASQTQAPPPQPPPKPVPEPAPQEQKIPEPPKPAAPEMTMVKPTAPQARPRSDVIAASVRGLVTIGLTPHPAPGFGTLVRFPDNRRLQGAVGLLWAPEATLKDDGFSVGLTAGRAGACFRPWSDESVWTRTCASFLVGALHATGRDKEVSPVGDQFWSAAGLEASVGFMPANPFFLELAFEAVVPFVRDVFMERIPPRNGFEQPVVAGVLSLGAGVAIP